MLFWRKKYSVEELQKFYRNEMINTESIYLNDMWNLSPVDMEKKHDFIQWMFPTMEQSFYNKKAPVLSYYELEVLKHDSVVMQNFQKSIAVFLDFLGIELLSNQRVRLGKDFEYKSQNWLTPRNHNYKRITRLLTFLRLFEFDTIADNLMELLNVLYNQNRNVISIDTYTFWEHAAQPI